MYNEDANDGVMRAWYQAAMRTAVIAGVLVVVACALLVVNQVRIRQADPTTSPTLQRLQQQLAETPTDEALKARIRAVDQRLRDEYFRRGAFAEFGVYLLLGAAALCLLSLKYAGQFRRKLPMPSKARAGQQVISARGRLAVSALGVALAGGMTAAMLLSGTAPRFTTGMGQRREPPSTVAEPAAPGDGAAAIPEILAGSATATSATATVTVTSLTAVPAPTNATAAVPAPARAVSPTECWPVFRGSTAGIAPAGAYPTTWDGASGTNIRWKTAIPLPGHNSPIVWGDRVFLSGASAARREVYCLDAATGTLRWTRAVRSAEDAPEVGDDTGYAASTMATDGHYVFAIFATGDIVAIDFAGKTQWTRELGVPENMYGHASSLALYRDLLIVQYDQGHSGEDGLSTLLALDTGTGHTRWQTAREVGSSWSSPIVISTGTGSEIITCANPWVIAYDPGTGKERWRAECLGGEIAPSPAFGGGLLFTCNMGASLSAIRPGGAGNVTSSRIAWTADEGMPDIVSPVATGEVVVLVETFGMVTCYDLNGAKAWDHAFDGSFNASPVVAGHNVYLTDTDGVTHIFAAGRTFTEVAKSALGEGVHATPAFAGDHIYLRGKKHLYCIGGKG